MPKQKIKWKKITAREYGVQYSEMQIRSLTDKVKRYLPYTTYNQIIIPEGNNACFLIAEDDWNKLVQSLYKKFSSSTTLLDKFEKQFRKFGADYSETAKKISRKNLTKLTNKDLKKLYVEYQQKLLRYSVFVWAGFILNNFVAQKAKEIIEKYLKKYSEKEKIEITEDFLRPLKKAAALQFQEDVEKIRGNFSEKSVNELYLKYRWLPCLDIHNKHWSKKEFREHLKTFKAAKRIQSKPKSIKEILRKLKIKEKDRLYLEIAQRFTYIIDARDDFRRKGVFYARTLFKEITERMGIKLKDISYLQEKEIITFLGKGEKVSPSIIKERQKGFLLYFAKNGNIICEQGKTIPETLRKLGVKDKEKRVEKVKGIIASSGKAKGKTVIVRGVKDLKEVKKGNIMVAITTHPDFVPAMRKTRAIVTDEGGLSCHAAIVSRELGIPCIVGTKIATKVLKDGDLVEVNANKGIVKILKKAK